MGSSCSTEVVVEARFDMPGVPAAIAVETFRDIQSAPSFIPLFLSIEKVRGRPSEVGFCWLERRSLGKNGQEVLLRKTITERSDDPFFSQSAHNELVQSTAWSMPDFISTCPVVLALCGCGERASGGKALPALGAAGLDDGSAGAGGHAGRKTVSARALQAAWLKCTLHVSIPCKKWFSPSRRNLRPGTADKRGEL